MYMKTKIIISALLCALTINASSAEPAGARGNVGVGYASDYIYRGQQLSDESVQWTAGANANVGGTDLFVGLTHNDAFDGDDATLVTAGAGRAFLDELLEVYVGLENRRVDSDNKLDVFISSKLNTILNPTLLIARNTEDSLYTYELNLRHSVDVGFGKVCVVGGIGTTDVTNTNEREYTSVGAEFCKSLGDVDLSAGVHVVDSDDLDKDTVSVVSLAYKF